MQGRIISGITPQQKMVAVNNKFGNVNIKSQQGTTRTLFDSLPISGAGTYRFFENAQQRAFPFTNLGAEGNRLNVGETFTLQKIYFSAITIDPDTGEITNFTEIAGATSQFTFGELDFIIANNQVVKQLPLLFNDAASNFTAVNTIDSAFNFATDIIIPPLLEYICQIRVADPRLVEDTFIRCTIQGTAGILAPQTTF